MEVLVLPNWVDEVNHFIYFVSRSQLSIFTSLFIIQSFSFLLVSVILVPSQLL